MMLWGWGKARVGGRGNLGIMTLIKSHALHMTLFFVQSQGSN